MKMQQTADARRHHAARAARAQRAALPRHGRALNCSNDDFIRTTEQRHHRASQAIWERMEASGDIYLDKYSGWYSVRDEAYLRRGRDASSTRRASASARSGTPVEWVEEESYFFRLSAYQDKLLELYARACRISCCRRSGSTRSMSFVKGGLQDLSISRTTFDWGIPVPGQSASTSCMCGSTRSPITSPRVGFPDTESEKFRRYWPADLHVIGKDIVRFHAVYWPAFLMSAGIDGAAPRLLATGSCSIAGRRCRSRSAT